jgi:hypothetical protein
MSSPRTLSACFSHHNSIGVLLLVLVLHNYLDCQGLSSPPGFCSRSGADDAAHTSTLIYDFIFAQKMKGEVSRDCRLLMTMKLRWQIGVMHSTVATVSQDLNPRYAHKTKKHIVKLKDRKLLNSFNSTAMETGIIRTATPLRARAHSNLLPRITAVISHPTARTSFHGANHRLTHIYNRTWYTRGYPKTVCR